MWFQPKIQPLDPSVKFQGQTIIITGANSGIGLEAARQLLKLDASRVIIAVRSVKKGEEAVAALKSDPGLSTANLEARVEIFALDLDHYESVLAFVRRVKEEVKELDILMNNAGVNLLSFQKSKSGHERTMQGESQMQSTPYTLTGEVNAYSHFLLSLELLPLLCATAQQRGKPSHIIFTGSFTQSTHSLGSKPIGPEETFFARFDDAARFSGLTRYPDSKLAVMAFVHELALRVSPSEIIVNNLCPGFVNTGFDDEQALWLRSIMSFLRKTVARSLEEGGRTLLHAATADSETQGKFFRNSRLAS